MKVYIIKEFIRGSYEGYFNIGKVFTNEQDAIDYCGEDMYLDYKEVEVE